MSSQFKFSNPDICRINICKKLASFFRDMDDAEKVCINLEKGIYNYSLHEANMRKIVKKWDNPRFVQLYVDRLRSIYMNLNNTDLLQQIKNREIAPQSVAFMSHQEMDHDHWKELIDRKLKRDASKFSQNRQASTDMFTCKKCRSKHTTFYELQTRSADEPATIFITCLDCGCNMKK